MLSKNRVFLMLFCSIFLAIFLVACSSNEESSQAHGKGAESNSSKEYTVSHTMGETKIPGKPRKVVVLDSGALDNTLALGVKPIGATTVFIDEPFPTYIKDQVEGVKNVGTTDQPNLETIAGLKPDLILGSKDIHEAIYDKLSKIAPTVFVEELGITWKDNLKLQAEALGKVAEGDKLLDDYKKRLDNFKEENVKNNNSKISILRVRTDHIAAYLKDSFSSSVIQDAGLLRPSSQDKNGLSVKLSEEQIDQMDGDEIFWFTRDEQSFLNDKIMKNPAWKNLNAVKENKVYQVSDETWLTGLGVQAANHIIDDLYKYLVK